MKLNIKNLSEDDRPREKLVKYGPEALSKSELLAIIIGSGSSGENAVSLMQRMLRDNGDKLRNIGKRSLEELQSYKGIGFAKAVTIKAACQIGKLMQAEEIDRKETFDAPEKVRDIFAPRLMDKQSEECWALMLNPKLQLIKEVQISKGGISEATVDIRIILKEALMAQAPNMILVHNHPSGNVSPSRQDDKLTKRLYEAAKLMEIALQDHIILGGNDYYSYRAEGKI